MWFFQITTRTKEIAVRKWNDNKLVIVASTAAKTKRFPQQKKYVDIDKPALIKTYNENVGVWIDPIKMFNCTALQSEKSNGTFPYCFIVWIWLYGMLGIYTK